MKASIYQEKKYQLPYSGVLPEEGGGGSGLANKAGQS